MALPIAMPFPVMEATTRKDIPTGEDWQYEPKWDGFRCLVFKDGKSVMLQSKAGKPLGRYFPEVVDVVTAFPQKKVVVDTELVVEREGRLSFDDLLLRIHPAESRIKKLAAESPATLVLFDLLVTAAGKLMVDAPLDTRRAALVETAKRIESERVYLTPATYDLDEAQEWARKDRGALDGIIAKRRSAAYEPDRSDAMVKVKFYRSADCVIGGFRYSTTNAKVVGSILLGLYEGGLLHHVGHATLPSSIGKTELTRRLEALAEAPGFTGRAPGGKSRWATERSTEWTPVRPELVVEVQFDHFSGDRFRHGTKFLRFRPDKLPEKCTLRQVKRESKASILSLVR